MTQWAAGDCSWANSGVRRLCRLTLYPSLSPLVLNSPLELPSSLPTFSLVGLTKQIKGNCPCPLEASRKNTAFAWSDHSLPSPALPGFVYFLKTYVPPPLSVSLSCTT